MDQLNGISCETPGTIKMGKLRHNIEPKAKKVLHSNVVSKWEKKEMQSKKNCKGSLIAANVL